jgi:hypothetical protein
MEMMDQYNQLQIFNQMNQQSAPGPAVGMQQPPPVAV